jgi:hypothetical protein
MHRSKINAECNQDSSKIQAKFNAFKIETRIEERSFEKSMISGEGVLTRYIKFLQFNNST